MSYFLLILACWLLAISAATALMPVEDDNIADMLYKISIVLLIIGVITFLVAICAGTEVRIL